ncbi:MAG: sigma 54-interacting transcriptional regulator [Bullifex sp.]
MVKVLVIVPYEELLSEYELAIERSFDPLVNFTTSFMYGTDARELEKASDYDIIVVRGLTSRALSLKYPEITVVDIRMDAFDVATALLEAKKKYPGTLRIGLILPKASICTTDLLSELTGVEVVMREAHGEGEMVTAITELAEAGCEVFIGGLTLKRISERLGYRYVHIRTGRAAIETSIKEAITAAHILDRERSRSGLLKALVDNTPDCLLIIDEKGVVTAANQSACSFFRRDSLTGLDSGQLFPMELFTLSGDVEVVQTIGDQVVLITEHPVNSEGEKRATYVSIRPVEDIRRTESKIRTKLQQKGLSAKYTFSDIVTGQVEMKQLIAKALRYAQVEGNVLLTGETGTGKELFVQSMHNASPRRDKPFVAVNCAAFSEELLESELFGYTEGAFTGAARGGRTGLFELASGGTIFLDEIGEMPIRCQAKLLRVIQEKEVRKIGGDEFIPVDVRIMSATNQDIPALIEKGLFRRDLYYRINLLALHIPPLRDRKDDIPAIFRRFVERKSASLKTVTPAVTEDALESLRNYSWPGNIRELRNVAERAVIFSTSGVITGQTIADIDSEHIGYRSEREEERERTPEGLYRMYAESGMTLAEFAASMGISRTTLWRKFRNLNK